MLTIAIGAAIAAGLMLLLTGTKILQEYERGVVFRFGRARKALASPGFNLLLPFGIDRIRVVDTRTRAIQITPQDIISHDNITISVDAVVYASVNSPSHAILEVEDYMPATLQLASTTLRAVLGKMDLDDILAHRDKINVEIRTILDTRTEQWGVEISAVEIKDIQLPKEMQRAMARQAEAERERRAKVIAAEGEVQAAAKLAQAAQMIAGNPGALQLRLYQTLVEVAGEASSTIVFPVPIDLGMAAAAPTAAQTQAMMASALALASNQQAKQLGAPAAKVDAAGDESESACRSASAGLDATRRNQREAETAPAAGRCPSAARWRRRTRLDGRGVSPASMNIRSRVARQADARRRRAGRRRRPRRRRANRRPAAIGRADRRRPLLLLRARLAVGLTGALQAGRDGGHLGEREPGRPGRPLVGRGRLGERAERRVRGGVDDPRALGQRQYGRRRGDRRERSAAVGRAKQRRRPTFDAERQQRPGAACARRRPRPPSNVERRRHRRPPVGGDRQRVARRPDDAQEDPIGVGRIDGHDPDLPGPERAPSDRSAPRSRRRRWNAPASAPRPRRAASARSIVIGSDRAISMPVTRSPGAAV